MRPFACAVLLSLAACHASPDVDAARAAPTLPAAQTVASEHGPVRVEEIARGLVHPWSVALLPDGGFLVTERPGRLRRVTRDGAVSAPIKNVPAVWAHGQGGLLDVVLAPDFARSHVIYLSYAEAGDEGTAGTAVARATLGTDALTDVHRIYQQQPKLEGPNHFGSRLAFDREGHLFISQGERFHRTFAQQLDKLQGKLVRLNADGSIPRDNPFAGRRDARAEIWSYGHRNSQSLAVDPQTGAVWEGEHGPMGGDEINRPKAGGNYGWPISTYGIDYSGLPISESRGPVVTGTEQPYHVWRKSPAISGMAFLRGQPTSAWNNSLFVGALADGTLIRLQLDGERIVGEERLLRELGERIRDVRTGEDGAVYVLTDADNGRLLKLLPPKPSARRGAPRVHANPDRTLTSQRLPSRDQRRRP